MPIRRVAVTTPFARKLRELRLRKRLKQAELAKMVWLSHGRISQFESGECLPPRDVAVRLDEALEANGTLLELWESDHANPEDRPLDRVARLEAHAAVIWHYSGGIYSMLQTEDYAREILAAGVDFYGGDLDQNVAYRMRRRSLIEGPEPPQLWTLVRESALSEVVGSPEVMRDQLADLVKMAERPHVHIQVLPFAIPRMLISGHMTIMEPRKGKRPTVYTASLESAKFITKPADVARFRALHERLRRDALPEDESIAFIRTAIEEKYPCLPPST
ncbi:helix-turn-helix domain-containing protein [Streptomyces gamaensis]|uniref:Helix-turn-helix domain-containing protein n=1 Tax=Streptomyces gamaensis TaxID=1763542 RepID=A0ABW0Z5R3_9ACTN